MKLVYAIAIILAFLSAFAVAQSEAVITVGLNHPNKVILGPRNSLLVSEDGYSAANSARISIIDQTTGERRSLVEGLPSALSTLGGEAEADGVTGLYLDGFRLFATIGIGDGALPGPGPGLESPNPTPSSPLFDSILEFDLPFGLGFHTGGFTLTMADQQRLAEGRAVWLRSGRFAFMRVRMVVDLPNYIAAPTPEHPENVKASHIYGIARYRRHLYVSDSGLNRITRISISRHPNVETVVQFPVLPNPTPIGAPVIEVVPDNVHLIDGKLLVPTLTGFPFVPGLADIRAVDQRTGASSTFISGLTSAIDVAKTGCGRPWFLRNSPWQSDHRGYLTLEFSTNLLAGALGRLRYYETPTSEPEDIASDLITPAGMAVNNRTNTIFVTNLGPGTLTRIVMP